LKAKQNSAEIPQPKVIRRLEVARMVGVAVSTIDSWARAESTNPTFPKPMKLGGRAVGYFREEVEAWLATRIAERTQQVG
jgi:prophage regulatory protein